MSLTIPVFEHWTWPWAPWTLHALYLFSGMMIALHYLPQLRRAWRFPAATAAAQSLLTWTVWTLCRAVALLYCVFVLHDLVFLIVVSADILGRLAMVMLIVRARVITRGMRRFGRRAAAHP